jgi:hypothetical protein
MILILTSSGIMWTILIILVLVIIFGVLIVTDDFNWFD